MDDKPEKDLEDKFKPTKGKIEKTSQKLFDVASAVSANYSPPKEEPIDLIKDQMKKTGRVPGQKAPVFVGEDGKPIFSEPKPDVQNKLNLPPMRDKISTFEIDGFKIPLCGIPQLDALTCFMYIMSRISQISADQIPQEVDRILTAFKFSFPDTSGKRIYPSEKSSTKKKRKKSKK